MTIHPSINLGRAEDNVSVGETLTLVATTVPANSVVTWTSSDDEVATIVDGVVTGVSAGTATITAKITVDGVDYTDTCNIIVTE
ncbi:Ig-like domain-containing protein [Eubacterium ruminantium]|uniref:Ig-like domain-containing protein n=1 Tax=Eubacterium ruminantium TaxID=42322 RepID=UPI0009994191